MKHQKWRSAAVIWCHYWNHCREWIETHISDWLSGRGVIRLAVMQEAEVKIYIYSRSSSNVNGCFSATPRKISKSWAADSPSRDQKMRLLSSNVAETVTFLILPHVMWAEESSPPKISSFPLFFLSRFEVWVHLADTTSFACQEKGGFSLFLRSIYISFNVCAILSVLERIFFVFLLLLFWPTFALLEQMS